MITLSYSKRPIGRVSLSLGRRLQKEGFIRIFPNNKGSIKNASALAELKRRGII